MTYKNDFDKKNRTSVLLTLFKGKDLSEIVKIGVLEQRNKF
jgi:hypothetical protein